MSAVNDLVIAPCNIMLHTNLDEEARATKKQTAVVSRGCDRSYPRKGIIFRVVALSDGTRERAVGKAIAAGRRRPPSAPQWFCVRRRGAGDPRRVLQVPDRGIDPEFWKTEDPTGGDPISVIDDQGRDSDVGNEDAITKHKAEQMNGQWT